MPSLRQRPTALPGLTAKSHYQLQLGVDGVEVANDVPAGGLASAHGEVFASHCIGRHLRVHGRGHFPVQRSTAPLSWCSLNEPPPAPSDMNRAAREESRAARSTIQTRTRPDLVPPGADWYFR